MYEHYAMVFHSVISALIKTHMKQSPCSFHVVLVYIVFISIFSTHCRILLFFICCIAALIPQSLLEFRYYIIPYLLYRLHSMPVSVWGNVFECAYYNLINAITLWLFLKRPFKWEGQDDLQRFMW